MKLLLLLEWALTLILFFFMVRNEVMLAICLLIFSFIYLFGVLESHKDPQRIHAHAMVGGVLFFITAFLVFLNDLSKLELNFNASRIMLIVLGVMGLIQARAVRKHFK